MRAIGYRAQALIAAGCAGRVLAVVSGAVYLQTDAGEVFWLVREPALLHARSIVCAWPEDEPAVGMAFRARGGLLQIGAHVQVDGRAATVWRPRPIASSALAPRAMIAARLAAMAGDIDAPRPAEPFLCFEDRFAGLTGVDINILTEHSKPLIGLGPGLTPAGDDFVGGLFFALHHWRAAHARTWDMRPIADLLAWARGRTGIISYAFLCDLAGGQGPAPLHDLLGGLIGREATADVAECVGRLRSIGASTGTQMLAGALTALRLVVDGETPTPFGFAAA